MVRRMQHHVMLRCGRLETAQTALEINHGGLVGEKHNYRWSGTVCTVAWYLTVRYEKTRHAVALDGTVWKTTPQGGT